MGERKQMKKELEGKRSENRSFTSFEDRKNPKPIEEEIDNATKKKMGDEVMMK
jgi:hypothetical protein